MMTKSIFYFIFSALSILWGWRIDRIDPDRYDILFRPIQEEKIKAHAVRSHCGGEADIWLDIGKFRKEVLWLKR
jgi:hypothetical protein